MEIRALQSDELEVLQHVAPGVFDDPILDGRCREFLQDPRHHLIVAIEDGVVVGMISAVHYVHPDKPSPELWINEVGVAETHHRRGIGKAMMRAVLDVGRRLGCQEAWVLTDRGNRAAMRLYAASGGTEGGPQDVMFNFWLNAAPGKPGATDDGDG